MSAMSHPLFARFYQRISEVMDRAGAAEHRQALTAGLRGRVIEIGAGNGRMFAHYPPQVTEVLAVEPEPHLRAAALDAAQTAPVPIKVIDGLAEDLPAERGVAEAGQLAIHTRATADPAATQGFAVAA